MSTNAKIVPVQDAWQAMASAVIRQWKRDGQPDAAGYLARHPELNCVKSIVLDLAYEEYCLRLDKGESVDIRKFCDRFPDHTPSLMRQIELHELLAEAPDAISNCLSPAWPRPDDVFLGYRVVEELGSGAFARVYLATEEALGERHVVIKVSTCASDEARILGKMQHPSIVPVFSVKHDNETGLSLICMPHLGRATLYDVLDRINSQSHDPTKAQIILDAIRAVDSQGQSSQMSLENGKRFGGCYIDGVLRLVLELASALEAAHERGIVHLDLKPSNVLMTIAGRPMLLDFNLAFDHQVATSRIGGTLPYMSPEQLRAWLQTNESSETIGGRSDIFSLGVILHEALFGSLPFNVPANRLPSEDIADNLLCQQQEGRRSARKFNRNVCGSVSSLIDRCLAFSPDDRFQSASELIDALRSELSFLRRTRRRVARYPFTAAVVTCGFTSLVVGLLAFSLSREPYGVRQFRRGLDHYQQGEYDKSLKALDFALEANPESVDALVARGRTKMALGKFESAIDDLKNSLDREGNPKVMILLGYCANKAKYHWDAIHWYQRGIESGLESATVYSNLGFSYHRLGLQREAKMQLDRAVELDDKLQEAHHNRAIVDLWLAKHDGRCPQVGIDEIEAALRSGEATGELYRDAARIYAFAAKFEPGLKKASTRYLRNAVECGVSPKEIIADADFVGILDDEITETLASAKASGSGRLNARRLIAP